MTRLPRLASVIGGRYELQAPLGAGGMAEVWQGRHVALGMPVAVKLLHPRLIAKASSRERFLTEAKVMAALETRHAVRVFDFGITPDEQPYLVMELVDGETLGQKLAREGPFAPPLLARLLGQAARGLERAHALGIVHRDFKPDNVLLTRDEDGHLIAKVCDFGVAKLLSSSRWEVADNVDGAPPQNDFAGTPVYMAPEQLVHSGEATTATDVWSFGVVAYELATGRLPFRARDFHALGRRVAAGEHLAPSSRNRSLPRAFDAWFLRACNVDPALRFSTIRAAARELAISLGEPDESGSLPPRRRGSAWALAAGAAVVAAGLVWTVAPRRTSTIVVTAPAQEASIVGSPKPPLEPPAAETSSTARSVAPRTMTVRRSVLPSYRALPDDQPSPPPRGFKNDPYLVGKSGRKHVRRET